MTGLINQFTTKGIIKMLIKADGFDSVPVFRSHEGAYGNDIGYNVECTEYDFLLLPQLGKLPVEHQIYHNIKASNTRVPCTKEEKGSCSYCNDFSIYMTEKTEMLYLTGQESEEKRAYELNNLVREAPIGPAYVHNKLLVYSLTQNAYVLLPMSLTLTEKVIDQFVQESEWVIAGKEGNKKRPNIWDIEVSSPVVLKLTYPEGHIMASRRNVSVSQEQFNGLKGYIKNEG
jgi:hypothetical protein